MSTPCYPPDNLDFVRKNAPSVETKSVQTGLESYPKQKLSQNACSSQPKCIQHIIYPSTPPAYWNWTEQPSFERQAPRKPNGQYLGRLEAVDGLPYSVLSADRRWCLVYQRYAEDLSAKPGTADQKWKYSLTFNDSRSETSKVGQ